MTRLPPILVVNLDRDADRLAHMEKECGRLGLSFQRFPAVLGEDVPASLRANFFDASGNKITHLKRGEIGCYASHLAIFERMIAGALPDAVVVLEDDVELAADFAVSVAGALDVLPEGWDIVRLSNVPKRAYVPLARLSHGRSLVRYSVIPNSTGAYMISLRGARKLIGPQPRMRAIDRDLRYGVEYGLRTFGIVPVPVTPDVLTSTIDALEAGRLDKGVRRKVRRAEDAGLGNALRRAAFNWRALGAKRWLACFAINGADKALRRLGRPSLLPRAARWLAHHDGS